MSNPQLHPQMAADTHRLGCLGDNTLLLHKNASVGWLILVPAGDCTELHELGPDQYRICTTQIRQLANFAETYFNADKINIAALGNIVPQLHIHVIARHKDDLCWPLPVWGHLQATDDYSIAAIHDLQTALTKSLQLVPDN